LLPYTLTYDLNVGTVIERRRTLPVLWPYIGGTAVVFILIYRKRKRIGLAASMR
jgi:hypothetical protein